MGAGWLANTHRLRRADAFGWLTGGVRLRAALLWAGPWSGCLPPEAYLPLGVRFAQQAPISATEAASEAGKSCQLMPPLALVRVAPCSVRPKTNSPSPAQRSVQLGAREANSSVSVTRRIFASKNWAICGRF